MRRYGCIVLLATLVSVFPIGSIGAQTTGDGCGALKKTYDEDMKTANGLLMKLVEKATGSGSGMLNQLGIAGQKLSPEQAISKGAVAAMSPPAQGAVLIYLLRANTTMQEMVWKGCNP